MKKYIPEDIESKWQKRWREEKLFSPSLDKATKPFYNLWMFPYPSGEGLHVGHFYASTGSDIYGRFTRMRGYDVFQPIGYDAFGIHSENYALKVRTHPADLIGKTTVRYQEQLKQTGHSYDWTRTVNTSHPDYYKWTQWIFLQMFKKGLAYRQKATVNWCPSCKTVLADEQVISGECERCSSQVTQKELEQWFFKITKYAERLLKNLDWIDWTIKIKIAQRHWIGQKIGINIAYQVEDSKEKITCFTTRPDTNFGATFIVVGPEHPFVGLLLNSKKLEKNKLKKIKQYVTQARQKSEVDRIALGRKKTGVFTGCDAINNLNGEKMPIWVSDFVLGHVGTGAVVGVPGHDRRDFEFAKQFKLPVIRVVVGRDGDTSAITQEEQVQEDEGVMINSEFLNGLDIQQATQKIMDYLEDKGWGKRVTTYHLRDWLISRQRYWGPPIPIIYCDKCGMVAVEEKDLPVKLPYIKEFQPRGKGQSPLASDPNFVNVKCPTCGSLAKRETDVSDTFLDSAWYFLRYPSTDFDNQPFERTRTKKWLPVNMYIGGAEHAVLHLLYARFVTMVLYDLGLIEFEEPFEKFRAHGLLIKDGAKMSKSKGNVVVPDKYVKQYGADMLRTYLMFMGPFEEGGDFRDSGINGIYRFLQRIWGLQEKTDKCHSDPELDSGVSESTLRRSRNKFGMTDQDLKIMHKTIKKVGEDIEQLKYNTAIAALMEWLNRLSRKEKVSKVEYKTFLLLLAPFAPHITEELWSHFVPQSRTSRDKHWSIHHQSWPKFDSRYLEEEQMTVVIQVNGKVRDTLMIQKDIINNKEIVQNLALASKKAQKFLEGKSVKKTVYVPGKIISIVTIS